MRSMMLRIAVSIGPVDVLVSTEALEPNPVTTGWPVVCVDPVCDPVVCVPPDEVICPAPEPVTTTGVTTALVGLFVFAFVFTTALDSVSPDMNAESLSATD